MQSTLTLIDKDENLEISVVVTGMHLSKTYGNTIQDIEASKIKIAAKIPTTLHPTTGATMSRAIGTMTRAFTDIFVSNCPDIILLLGDRGEMLAAAIAAIHLNIPVAHIHGGERSGTVDELVRHAITKLSHIHFVATQESKSRVIAMGENPNYVIKTGAPGLDGLTDVMTRPKKELWTDLNLSMERPTALFLFHPVLQETCDAKRHASEILSQLFNGAWQVVALMPNADAGGAHIQQVLQECHNPDLHCLIHLPRLDFLSYMKTVDVMIGNSSAGIIEAASFGTPVLNIGSRQALRERNTNVLDIDLEKGELCAALKKIETQGRFPLKNIYGDGQAGMRICQALKQIIISSELTNKVMTY